MAEPPGKTAPDDPETARVIADAGVIEAWRFAAEAHAGQLRKANLGPYIHHPERIAVLVAGQGADAEMVAASLLHDVLEDTPVEPEQVSSAFGAGVGELVNALSDDRSITDYARRKTALREQVRKAGARPALIYAADKFANCDDLREGYAELGEDVAERLPISLDLRITIWRDDAAMCAEALGENEIVAALGSSLDALERDRATSAIG